MQTILTMQKGRKVVAGMALSGMACALVLNRTQGHL
jgi:hypothetical protein